MQKEHERIRARGAQVVVVSFGTPQRLAVYERAHPFPFRMLTDPDLRAYNDLNLGRTSWLKILAPGTIWRYLKMIFRGWLPEKPSGADLYQLGGDFVIDRSRRLLYAHPSAEPTDRPSPEALLQALASVEGPQTHESETGPRTL